MISPAWTAVVASETKKKASASTAGRARRRSRISSGDVTCCAATSIPSLLAASWAAARAETATENARVIKGNDAAKLGHDLAQDFEPLRREIDGQELKAGQPSAWRRDPLDQSGRNRVGSDGEHDRHLFGSLLGGASHGRRDRHDDVDLIVALQVARRRLGCRGVRPLCCPERGARNAGPLQAPPPSARRAAPRCSARRGRHGRRRRCV